MLIVHVPVGSAARAVVASELSIRKAANNVVFIASSVVKVVTTGVIESRYVYVALILATPRG